jgi:type II secretory pathway pseudopilin PulG
LCLDNNTVVVITGILAAIAIPNYIGQQQEAKDAAAMAQLRMAATPQTSKPTVSGRESKWSR